MSIVNMEKKYLAIFSKIKFDKNIWAKVLIPLLSLAILDGITTWIGVCHYGGIELNESALNTAIKHGFLYLQLTSFLNVAFFTGMIAFFLSNAERGGIYWIVWGVIFTFVLLDFSQVVYYNLNYLMIAALEKPLTSPEDTHKVSSEKFERISTIMDEGGRSSFCRLL